MSSIYDNKKNAELLDGGLSSPSQELQPQLAQPVRKKEADALPTKVEMMPAPQPEEQSMEKINQELASYQERSFRAMELVDDIVLKNYLTKLSQFEVIPYNDANTDNIILFQNQQDGL